MPLSIEQILTERIRDIPDWPEPGVLFRDISPLLADHEAFTTTIRALADLGQELAGGPIDKVLGMEARGFILAAPVALALGAGFVPVRKIGKLPAATHTVEYDLEYGSATLEIHHDALEPSDRVLLVDDVLATGGTIKATQELVELAGAKSAAVVVLLELEALRGRDLVDDGPLGSLRIC